MKGPILSEEEFNLTRVIPNVKKLVKAFDIQRDSAEVICTDDYLADRLFMAAIEFLCQTGIYCDSIHRVIPIEHHEIQASITGLPEGAYFGEGRDRRLFLPRRPGDGRLPWFHTGAGIVSSTRDLALSIVEGYGRIDLANSISIPAFNLVNGMQVISGSPLELHAAVQSVQAGREALVKSGRPGLPILNLVSSATTPISTLAASFQAFGLRPSDGWLVDFIAEMKVNFDTLNRLAFLQLIGGNVGSTALPILGGYGGGAPGTALLMTAYYLAGMSLLQGDYHLTGPIHFRYGCSTNRDCLWVFSIVGRAASRNARYPAIALGYTANGSATARYLYEAAALMLACVPAGFPGVQTAHPAKAVIEDGITPLDAQFCIDVACAAARLQPWLADHLVRYLLEKYESSIPSPQPGLRYPESYDLQIGQPRPEISRLYAQVKDELARQGLPL